VAKTYIPSEVKQVHELAQFMTRYNSVLRAAVALADPSAITAYDALYSAIVAFDAFREALVPLAD
jgi:predicted nucleic acid-binding protein